MHIHPRFIIWFSAIFFLSVFSGCGKKGSDSGPKGKPGDQKPAIADAIVAEPGELVNRITSTGTILANEEVELRSEVSGRITGIRFTEGSRVSKGDLLLKIDDSELQAQQKKLLLDEKLAEEDVARKKRLLDIKAISAEEYEKTLNQLDIIRANIDLNRTQVAKTEIKAPFSGLVGLRQVSEGGYITAATLISRLQQTDRVKIEFSVPEKYNTLLRNGMQVEFEVAGVNRKFSARIYAVEPLIDPSTRAVKVRAITGNPGNLLVPGAFAKVSVNLQTIPDALTLPAQAIIPVIDGEKVLVCSGGKVASRKIVTGIRTESTVQVTEGLRAGDTVFVSGLLTLKDDMKVNPRVRTGEESKGK